MSDGEYANFENDGDRVDPQNFEGMIYRIRATIWCNFYFKIQYTDVDLLDVNLVDDEEVSRTCNMFMHNDYLSLSTLPTLHTLHFGVRISRS